MATHSPLFWLCQCTLTLHTIPPDSLKRPEKRWPMSNTYFLGFSLVSLVFFWWSTVSASNGNLRKVASFCEPRRKAVRTPRADDRAKQHILQAAESHGTQEKDSAKEKMPLKRVFALQVTLQGTASCPLLLLGQSWVRQSRRHFAAPVGIPLPQTLGSPVAAPPCATTRPPTRRRPKKRRMRRRERSGSGLPKITQSPVAPIGSQPLSRVGGNIKCVWPRTRPRKRVDGHWDQPLEVGPSQIVVTGNMCGKCPKQLVLQTCSIKGPGYR